jgi:hypothetical protein
MPTEGSRAPRSGPPMFPVTVDVPRSIRTQEGVQAGGRLRGRAVGRRVRERDNQVDILPVDLIEHRSQRRYVAMNVGNHGNAFSRLISEVTAGHPGIVLTLISEG